VGNIEYDIGDIGLVHLQLHLAGPADQRQYGLVVRDGFAVGSSTFWLDHRQQTRFADLKNLIDGIRNLGYTWVAQTKW
jgi:hypothetical protein